MNISNSLLFLVESRIAFTFVATDLCVQPVTVKKSRMVVSRAAFIYLQISRDVCI